MNFTEAQEWYEKAAAQGYAKAQTNLGLMHYRGANGPQDVIQARYWWEQAAAQGHGGAMAGIGLSYMHGFDVEQDLNEAMRWLLKAKAHGKDVSTEIAAVIEERKRQNSGLPNK